MKVEFARALELHRKGDTEAAELAYRQILADGAHPDALGNLGLILWRRGALSEAEATLRQAAELVPDGATQRYNLANFLAHVRQLPEAAAQARSAVALQSDLQSARL